MCPALLFFHFMTHSITCWPSYLHCVISCQLNPPFRLYTQTRLCTVRTEIITLLTADHCVCVCVWVWQRVLVCVHVFIYIFYLWLQAYVCRFWLWVACVYVTRLIVYMCICVCVWGWQCESKVIQAAWLKQDQPLILYLLSHGGVSVCVCVCLRLLERFCHHTIFVCECVCMCIEVKPMCVGAYHN